MPRGGSFKPLVRATATSAIRASRWGGRSLLVFLGGVALLFFGAAFLVWPVATVSIEPALEQVTITGSVLVDVDAPAFIPASGVVPGRVIISENEAQQGEQVVTVGTRSYAYQAVSANIVVASAVSTNLGTDYRAVKPWGQVQWGKPHAGSSGQLVSLPFSLTLRRYRHFLVADWRTYVRGLPVPEAQHWLESQPGVAHVRIALYPSFFANIRQKMPTNASLIRFSLDIAQETSILE